MVETNLTKTQMDTVAEFFLIQYGDRISRYTSYSTGLTFQGFYWAAGTISRSGFKQDRHFNSVTLSISTPLTDVMKNYISNYPIEPMSLTIYRALVDNLDNYRTFFSGKVIGVQMKDQQVNVQVESKNKILSRMIPRIVYQSFCNNDLFDDYGDYGCRLDPLAWVKHGTITDIDGYTVTVDFGVALPVDYFGGGRLIVGTDMRLIVANETPGVLILQIPFDSRAEVGASVTAYPGCDGNPVTCLDKFANWHNFLGMPLIPDHNPVLWGIR